MLFISKWDPGGYNHLYSMQLVDLRCQSNNALWCQMPYQAPLTALIGEKDSAAITHPVMIKSVYIDSDVILSMGLIWLQIQIIQSQSKARARNLEIAFPCLHLNELAIYPIVYTNLYFKKLYTWHWTCLGWCDPTSWYSCDSWSSNNKGWTLQKKDLFDIFLFKHKWKTWEQYDEIIQYQLINHFMIWCSVFHSAGSNYQYFSYQWYFYDPKKCFISHISLPSSLASGQNFTLNMTWNHTKPWCLSLDIFIENTNKVIIQMKVNTVFAYRHQSICRHNVDNHPDSKVHGANMGPTWVLSAPDGPHVGPMNLAIRATIVYTCDCPYNGWDMNRLALWMSYLEHKQPVGQGHSC